MVSKGAGCMSLWWLHMIGKQVKFIYQNVYWIGHVFYQEGDLIYVVVDGYKEMFILDKSLVIPEN